MLRNSREQPSSPFLVASAAAAGAQHSWKRRLWDDPSVCACRVGVDPHCGFPLGLSGLAAPIAVVTAGWVVVAGAAAPVAAGAVAGAVAGTAAVAVARAAAVAVAGAAAPVGPVGGTDRPVAGGAAHVVAGHLGGGGGR